MDTFIDTVMLPGEILEVFGIFRDTFNALPLVIRLVFTLVLGLTCLLAMLRMFTK